MSGGSNGRALRKLFWTLFFRGRATSRKRGEEGKVNRHTMAGTLLLYAFVGVFPCLAIGKVDTLTFATLLHGTTLFMVVMHMVSTAGSVLFDREEAEILLHRPVTPGELLRAKVFVLCAVTGLMAFFLNLPGLVAGVWLRDARWWFPVVHLASLAFMVVFCAGALVVAYQASLRWFGRERLDNIMTTLQTVLTVVLIAGSQSFRFLQEVNFEELKHAWWLLLLPPTWFAALDAALASTSAEPWMAGLAGLGVAATALVGWLGFHRLARTYGEGLMLLNERAGGEGGREKVARLGRGLRRVVRWPLLSGWLREPVERSAFVLVSAYLVRDRDTKLRLYPGLAQVLALPFVFILVGKNVRGDGIDVAMSGIYMGWLPLMALQMLACSDHWQASEILRATPGGRWQPLYHGARKAVLTWLALPTVAALLVVAFLTVGADRRLLLLLPNIMLLPVWSLLPGVMAPWRPLANAYDAKSQVRWGCLGMMVVMGVSGLVAVAGWGAMKQNLLPAFLAIELGLVCLTWWCMSRRIAKSGE